MQTFSYADLTLNTTGLVYLNSHALRLCAYKGQQLLAVGAAQAVEFYDAAVIIQGLHGNASEFDLPLPAGVDMQELYEEFTDEELRFLREYALGAEKEYMKTLVPAGAPQLILDRAKSLGFIIQLPSAVRALEAEVRERTSAALRSQILAATSEDLTTDYAALTDDQETKQSETAFGVVYKLDPALYERVVRNTGGRTVSSDRIKWPFNTMRVGDAVNIDPKLAKRAQTAVHVYAARMGRSFKTSTNRVTKVMNIIRTEDRE